MVLEANFIFRNWPFFRLFGRCRVWHPSFFQDELMLPLELGLKQLQARAIN